jgi:hypothetical protein
MGWGGGYTPIPKLLLRVFLCTVCVTVVLVFLDQTTGKALPPTINNRKYKDDLTYAPLQFCLCAVVEAPAKPAQRQEVRIADQIAIRSYVLAKNIGKIGETMNFARANIPKHFFGTYQVEYTFPRF